MLVELNVKIRGWYLGRHMDHLADSIADLCQDRKNRYNIQVEDLTEKRDIFNKYTISLFLEI